MIIILATHNKHKRDELAKLLGDHVEVQLLPEDFPAIEETGTTLEENARLKAQAVYHHFHKPVLADDTGLEVEALNGAPGVYTARFAGENATYEDNCRKLLHDLEFESNRNAVFKTVLCYLDSAGNEQLFFGAVLGAISQEEKGSNGFGYDPVFIPLEGGGKTFAEMSAEEKNGLSHRARAITLFTSWLSA
jgi:XTP/dITP diphosphohydrolase